MFYRQICLARHILQRLQRIVGVDQLQQHPRSGWRNAVQHFGQIDQQQHAVIGLERLQTPIDRFWLDDHALLVELMGFLGQTEAERHPLVDGGVQQAGGAEIVVNLSVCVCVWV